MEIIDVENEDERLEESGDVPTVNFEDFLSNI
jgi:hypothetical protein